MRYRVRPEVAWVSGDEIGAEAGIYLADVREPQPMVLLGSAELIWLVAAEGGDLPDDIEVADEAERETVRAQVRQFVTDLVARGFLEEDL